MLACSKSRCKTDVFCMLSHALRSPAGVLVSMFPCSNRQSFLRGFCLWFSCFLVSMGRVHVGLHLRLLAHHHQFLLMMRNKNVASFIRQLWGLNVLLQCCKEQVKCASHVGMLFGIALQGGAMLLDGIACITFVRLCLLLWRTSKAC